jgi:DNA-binding IclR family transcriptional regulator
MGLASETTRAASSSSVKSADRVMCVLETLARHTRPVPTMTIARQCGIPKSSAHHLLNVMRERHFVTYYEHERAWGLGVSVFEVGSAYLRRTPLQRLGRPLLEQVAARTGETTHLAILHGADVLYLDKEQPPGEAPQLVTEVGVRLPAHLTAVGRAILAQFPEAQVHAIFDGSPLVKRTDHGPTSVAQLLEDLSEVRRTGFAFDDQMVTPGICCLAAPVFSHEGVPVAAVGIAFLAAKRSGDAVSDLADIVSDASARLSAALGWRPATIAIEEVAG